MRRTWILAGFSGAVLAVLLIVVWQAIANDSRPTPATKETAPVALLDLTKVFQEHRGFKRDADKLRRNVEEAERQLAEHKAELKAAQDELAGLTRGSADAQQLEERIARAELDLAVHVARQKRSFADQETEIYRDCFQEIEAQVASYSKAHGVKLVMRFASDVLNPAHPQSLQKELSKVVLYQDGIDITDDIIRAVNAKGEE